MAQNDLLKRYLDAGMAFTAMTQARAEAIVRDLVQAGELQADQARDTATELLERSRKNTDKLLDTVRKEIRDQVANLGLATRAEINRLERRIAAVTGTRPPATTKAAAKKTATKKAAAKKAAARKAGTKKAAGKKAAGKKAATKKAAAKKAAAKKAAPKRAAKAAGATKR